MKCNLLFALGIVLCWFLAQSVYVLMERSKTSALMRIPQIPLVVYREILCGGVSLSSRRPAAAAMEGN